MIYLGGLAMPTHYLHNFRFGHTIYTICTHLQHIQDLAGGDFGVWTIGLTCLFQDIYEHIRLLFGPKPTI